MFHFQTSSNLKWIAVALLVFALATTGFTSSQHGSIPVNSGNTQAGNNLALLLPGAFAKSGPANGATGLANNLTLSWAASSGVTSYEYCSDTSNNNICNASWISTKRTSINLKSLTPGKTYYWQVRAKNLSGYTYANGGNTVWWHFSVLAMPGAFKKSLPANKAINLPNNPTLSWEASSNAAFYEYCMTTSNNNTCKGGWISTGTNTSFNLSSLTPGLTYYWQVRARNTNGTTYANGSATTWWHFTVMSLPGVFNKTLPANTTINQPTQLNLGWGSSSKADSYEYCIDTSNNNTCDTAWNSTGSATSATPVGMTPATTYYWQVRAKNVKGYTYANGSSAVWWSLSIAYSLDANTFVSAQNGDPDTLDPALAYDTTSAEVIQNVYDTLVFYDGAKTNTFVPQLASSYDLSGDGLTWTFHIRTGVTFHNGDSLTPADVAYSFQRGLLQGGSASPQWLLAEPFFGVGKTDISLMVDPTGSLQDNRAALQAWNPADLLAACTQVKAAIVADNTAGTVTMHLAQPWGPFLPTIAQTWGSIMDKNWTIARGGWDGSCNTWQNWYATNSGEDPLTAITNGTGPFTLDHWAPGHEVVLASNASYWRTPAQLERVVMLNIPDENTRLAMLQTGNADQAGVPGHITQADTLVGEDCVWNVSTSLYDCSVVDAAKPLRRYMGRPGISQDEVLINFNVTVPAGGNPYIGSGLLDGNGVPPDFFSDVHIRKAFNYCFDWDTFNTQARGGSAVQPTTLALEGMPGYDPSASHYTFDLTQAEAEFKASTLTAPTGGPLWDTGFHVQMLYNLGNSTRQAVAEILAANIHAVNSKFVVDVVGLAWPDYLAAQRAGMIPIMTGGWLEDIHDPHNWYQPYLVGAYGARAHIPDSLKAQFQVLIDQGVSATDFAGRDTIYKQLNQSIYNNAVFILLGGSTNHAFIQSRIKGQVLNPIFPGNYYYTIYKSSTPIFPGAFNKSLPASGALGQPTNRNLSWGTSDRATSYEYCIDTSNNNACDTAWVSAGSTTSVDLSGLTPATTYYWQVRATNTSGTAYGNGSSTAWWSFSVLYSLDANTFVSAQNGDPDTLDPALAYDTISGQVIQNIYETLVFYDADKPGSFVPQLAQSYDLSTDGLTWTFHIRPGVTFHNGDSLTASDVAYTFQRGLLQGGSASPQWLLAEPFFGVGVQDISLVVDPTGGLMDNRDALKAWNPADLLAACEQVRTNIVANDAAGTVSMHLAQPWGPFLATIAGTYGSIMDKNWTIAKGGWDGSCNTWQNWYAMLSGDDPLTRVTNGTGPFKLDHWAPGAEVVLARNDSYWQTPAHLSRVVILNIGDNYTRFDMLQNGEVDQASIAASEIASADALVGEDCTWNAATAQYDCSLADPAKVLRRYSGRPGITQDEGLFNFNIATAGGNPYIGSGQVNGYGIPPDFFSDAHIRKAFNYAFDWDAFNLSVRGGAALQPTTLALEGMPGYDPSADHYDLDLTQAEAEFKASSFHASTGASLWETGFYLQIPYNVGNPTRQKFAENLKANLLAINNKFVVDVVELSWTDYQIALRTNLIPIMTAGWLEDIHDPHNWYQPYLVGVYASRANLPDSMKADFQVFINDGVSTTDFAARDAIYKDLNQLVYNNAPFIMLGGAPDHAFFQRRVQGLVRNPIFAGIYFYPIHK